MHKSGRLDAKMIRFGDQILAATHNEGKLEELRELFQPYGVSVISAAALGLAEPEETESTFAGNARLKAVAAADASGMLALADDSGLCVDGLRGSPGVFTADWATAVGGRDFSVGMRRVYLAMQATGVATPWRARFCCTLALALPQGKTLVFSGEMAGVLVWPPRGMLGHGFDPMFQPDGYQKTCGELEGSEKNKVSHRARAFQRLLANCFT